MRQRYRTLADYFEQTGKTQTEFAKRVGVHRSLISHIAAGRKQPSLPLALKIAEAAGVPIANLLKDAAA